MSTESTANPAQQIAAGYAVEGQALELGAVVIDGKTDPTAQIRIPLATVNRHGLVAGATGTGKTKTLQVIAEQLSAAGVPVKAVTRSPLAPRNPATTGTQPPFRWISCRWEPRVSVFQCVPRSPASARSCCQRYWGSTLLRSQR